mmetsp:Transcript_7241/g.18935  ORF Transcript_7241/g.18935 Transcript_7241/m.18935 type:complete len:100 (+) Transcript_7241:131-430(+)
MQSTHASSRVRVTSRVYSTDCPLFGTLRATALLPARLLLEAEAYDAEGGAAFPPEHLQRPGLRESVAQPLASCTCGGPISRDLPLALQWSRNSLARREG